MEKSQKTQEEIVSRNIWGSPALFIVLAFLGFFFADTQAGAEKAWVANLAGWVPTLVMLARSAIVRRNPGIGAIVAFGSLLLFGGFFYLNNSSSFPL